MPPRSPTWCNNRHPFIVLLLISYIIINAAGVVALECEPPETDNQFFDKCSGHVEDLCIPGERLKYSQTDCPDENIMQCVPCEPGTFMPGYNFCEECRPKTPCEDGEVEVPSSRLSNTEDRTCEPAPVSSLSPECTPCPLSPECKKCPAPSTCQSPLPCVSCPTCPNTMCPVPDPDGTTSSTPTDMNSTENTQTEPSAQGGDTWKNYFFISLAVILFLIIVIVVLGVCLRRTNTKRKHKGVKHDHSDDQYDQQNGLQMNAHDACPSSDDEVHVDMPNMQQSREINDNSGSRNGSRSENEDECKTFNSEETFLAITNEEYQHSLANEQSGKEVAPENKGNSPVGEKAKTFKRPYSTSGDTPSAQPLLVVQSMENSHSGSLPNQAFLQQLSTSEHSERSVQDLSSKQPGSDFVHNMETAEYQQPPVNGEKTFCAWEKAEGDCAITDTCNEEHIDFVHEEVNVDTRHSFFTKLGMKAKDYGDVEFDYQNAKIRPKIHQVLLKWIRNYDHPIKTLVKALEKSDNRNLSIEFKKKFHVQ